MYIEETLEQEADDCSLCPAKMWQALLLTAMFRILSNSCLPDDEGSFLLWLARPNVLQINSKSTPGPPADPFTFCI